MLVHSLQHAFYNLILNQTLLFSKTWKISGSRSNIENDSFYFSIYNPSHHWTLIFICSDGNIFPRFTSISPQSYSSQSKHTLFWHLEIKSIENWKSVVKTTTWWSKKHSKTNVQINCGPLPLFLLLWPFKVFHYKTNSKSCWNFQILCIL